MKKNLIGKKRYFSAMAVILAMACLSGCAQVLVADEEQPVQINTVKEQPADEPIAAPEGSLKGWFLIASQKVVPGDFIENVIASSEVTEGFRNIRKLYDETETKKKLENGIRGMDITKEEPDFAKIFELSWDVSKDCYEDSNVSDESLEPAFDPSENGLYELEVAASDIHGNASVAKVYVLYDKATTTLSEFERHVEKISAEASNEQNEQASQADGFHRGKAEEAFAKVNEQRSANGVQALAWDESLYELACIRAKEIVSSFSHQRPDGSYVGDVIIRQYGAAGCGENIASNYTSTNNLIKGWLNSQGHKENLLNSRFTAGVMACYCHNGSYYWVNLFKQ